jgi:hypothetical protein
MSGEPFPRDALIDHLAAINGWELESVIVFDEGDKSSVNWVATYDVKRGLYIPSVTGIVTVSEMRQKWSPVGEPCFTVFMVSFSKRGRELGNQFVVTKNASDIEAMAYSRLKEE